MTQGNQGDTGKISDTGKRTDTRKPIDSGKPSDTEKPSDTGKPRRHKETAVAPYKRKRNVFVYGNPEGEYKL